MKTASLLLVPLLWWGCDDGPTVAPANAGADATVRLPDGAVDAAAPDASPIVDAAVPPDAAPDLGPPGEPTAQVSITRWQPDQIFPYTEAFASGFFEPALAALGVQSGVGWLAFSSLIPLNSTLPAGQWRLPEPGGEGDFLAPELVESVAALQFEHAGPWLAIGDTLVLDLDPFTEAAHGVPVYVSSLEDGPQYADTYPAGSVWPVSFAGGDDVGAWTIPDAVHLPDDLVLTTHDPLEAVPLRAGNPLVVGWLPSPDPDDYIVIGVDGEVTGGLLAVEDDVGQVDLSALINLHAAGNELDAVLIERVRRTRHRYPEGTLEVVASARQSLYLMPIGAYRVSPRVLTPGKPFVLTVEWPDDAFDPTAGLTLDLGDGVRVSGMVLDTSGHILRAQVQVADGAATGPRPVIVRQRGEVVLELQRRVFVVDDLASSGLCAEVAAEPSVADGTWLGTLDGLPPIITESACYQDELTGGAQAIPVDLLAGQTLTAELLGHEFAGMLALTRACDAPELSGCAHPLVYQMPTILQYTAPVDERLLLVVANADFRSGAFVVDIERSAPAPLVVTEPPILSVEANARFTVRSTRGPLADPPELQVSGVAATDVSLSPDRLEASGVVMLDPPGHPSRASVSATLEGGQRVQAEGAVRTRVFTSPRSCALGAAHTAGDWTGTTFANASEISALDACDVDPEGPEQLLRVDLEPGQTLQAIARLDQTDLVFYLLESCDDRRGLACADTGVVGDPEYLRYTAPNAPTTVYLGIDAFNPGEGDTYYIELDIGY